MEFEEVKKEDFLTFSRTQPSYVKLEQFLIEIGGTGVKGADFKKQALAAAGWSYGALVSYGAHPDKAAEVFNNIRKAMESSSPDDTDSLLSAISSQLSSDG